MAEALDVYLTKEGAAVKASDIARVALVYELGGFYVDLDLWLSKWDMNLMKIFDHVAFAYQEFKSMNISMVTTTYGFMARPNHPVTENYINEYRNEFVNGSRAFHLLPCFRDASITALYETGPFRLDHAYFMAYD